MPVLSVILEKDLSDEIAWREKVAAYLSQCAEAWECELVEQEGGYGLRPSLMYRYHGIFVKPNEKGCSITRETEATTWEDFLFVKLAHELAASFGGKLYFEDGERTIETAPEHFESFESYVETVVVGAPDLVRETKKQWIFNHQKRFIR